MNDCNAAVSVDAFGMDGQMLKCRFGVQVRKCKASTGRFEYDIVLRSTATGSMRNERRTAPGWNAASGNQFDITDEFPISPNDEVEDVVVDEDSIQSTRV